MSELWPSEGYDWVNKIALTTINWRDRNLVSYCGINVPGIVVELVIFLVTFYQSVVCMVNAN
jgi:hypothetical protein